APTAKSLLMVLTLKKFVAHARSVAKVGLTIANASKRDTAAKRDIRFPRGQNFSTKLACVSISDYGCTARVRLIDETLYLTARKCLKTARNCQRDFEASKSLATSTKTIGYELPTEASCRVNKKVTAR